MNAEALVLAVRLARIEQRSALPDAPVIAPRERETRAVRQVTARVLRRAADRLEPAVPSCA